MREHGIIVDKNFEDVIWPELLDQLFNDGKSFGEGE